LHRCTGTPLTSTQ